MSDVKPRKPAAGHATARPSRLEQLRRFGRVYRKLFLIVAPGSWGLIVAQLVLVAILALETLAQAGAQAGLVNALIAGDNRHAWILVGALLGVVLLWGALRTVRAFTERLFWFRLEERYNMALAEKMAAVDLAAHDDPRYKDLLARVREQGMWRAQSFMGDQTYSVLDALIRVVASVGAIAYFNQWVALVVLLATVPDFIAEPRAGSDVWSIWGADTELRRRYFNAREYLERARDLVELRLFQTGRFFIELIGSLLGNFQAKQVGVERKKLRYDLGAGFLANLGIGAALAWFVRQGPRGEIEPGTLLFLSASLFALHGAVASLFRELARVRTNYVFAAEIAPILDIRNEVVSKPGAPELPARETPWIVFDRVTFRYPGSNIDSLTDFSLDIPAGKKLALVGANGAGKTTVVRLLCRFYDPQKGRILVGGRDLRDLDLDSWHRTLAVLFQDFSRYTFPVEEAVAMGRDPANIDSAAVRAASKDADIDTFVQRYPKRYAQQLGRDFTDGVEPSGGQWQKLAIARVLYRKAKVMVLDEPTAAVDAESEMKIFEALEKLPDNQTVILISHRFSTVRQADEIVVIEDGKVSEQGSHEALLKLKGTYARLFSAQAEGYR